MIEYAPFLTEEEERELVASALPRLKKIAEKPCRCARQANRCQACAHAFEARNRVVMNVRPWVIRKAKRYAGRVPHEDLVSHAMMMIVDKFIKLDLSFKGKPSTYLTNVAERQMQLMSRQDGVIRRPADFREEMSDHRRNCAVACQQVGSLNTQIFEGDNPQEIGDTIADPRTTCAVEDAGERENARMTLAKFYWLSARDREIMKMRVLENLPLRVIGAKYRLSKERIRQVVKRATARMKKCTELRLPLPVAVGMRPTGAGPT